MGLKVTAEAVSHCRTERRNLIRQRLEALAEAVREAV